MWRSSLVLLPLFFSFVSAGEQAAGVKGVLLCNGRPLADTTVRLYDEDTGIFDADDKLAETRTDSAGRFQVQGYESEIFSITPKLIIYHDCDDGIRTCQRKVTFYVPSEYIEKGRTTFRFFDIGAVNMAAKFSGEKRECLHRV